MAPASIVLYLGDLRQELWDEGPLAGFAVRVDTYVPVHFSRVDLHEVPIYVITCADLRYVNTSNLY